MKNEGQNALCLALIWLWFSLFSPILCIGVIMSVRTDIANKILPSVAYLCLEVVCLYGAAIIALESFVTYIHDENGKNLLFYLVCYFMFADLSYYLHVQYSFGGTGYRHNEHQQKLMETEFDTMSFKS